MRTMRTMLENALTEYDRKQSAKRGWNRYALGQYLARVEEVEHDVKNGADLRAALTAAFTGKLLDVCLKAVGEAKSTDSEQLGALAYTPVTR